MHNFNLCTITIAFEFGSINGKIMQVLVDDELVMPDEKLKSIVWLPIRLPGKVTLKFSNKDSTVDTLVDQTGSIIQDLYVKLTEVRIDGFLLNEKYLYQKIKLTTESGEIITTSYIGFNGTVVLDFSHSTVFSQCLWLNQ